MWVVESEEPSGTLWNSVYNKFLIISLSSFKFDKYLSLNYFFLCLLLLSCLWCTCLFAYIARSKSKSNGMWKCMLISGVNRARGVNQSRTNSKCFIVVLKPKLTPKLKVNWFKLQILKSFFLVLAHRQQCTWEFKLYGWKCHIFTWFCFYYLSFDWSSCNDTSFSSVVVFVVVWHHLLSIISMNWLLIITLQ